jgi:hypothetical protein
MADDNFSERNSTNQPDIMPPFDFGEFDDDSDLEDMLEVPPEEGSNTSTR